MNYEEWIQKVVGEQWLAGLCKEYSYAMCRFFPELRWTYGLVHGTRGEEVVEEGHWWCTAPDGKIVDPTVSQFDDVDDMTYEEYKMQSPKEKLYWMIRKELEEAK